MVVLGMMFATPIGSLAQRFFQRRIFSGAFRLYQYIYCISPTGEYRETVAAGEHCSSEKSLPLKGKPWAKAFPQLVTVTAQLN